VSKKLPEMATRRSGQLVQRNVPSSDKNPDNDSDVENADGYESDEAGDKKEVRLTLMEEVLLLGLKDREV
jgi:Golgi phosphoprotein 3